MSARTRKCPAVKSGRCTAQGHRAMVHTCTHFTGHDAWHQCGCGTTWPNTPTTNTRRARRRPWRTEV